MFLFIGTALFSFYHSGAGLLPPELQDTAKSDGVFPFFIMNELPTGITGLVIASIFAAGMSTISTSYNNTATVFLTDYYQGIFKRSASDKQAMRVLYIFSLVVILWMSLSNLLLTEEALGNQFHTYLTTVFGTTVIFLVGFLFTLLAKPGSGKSESAKH